MTITVCIAISANIHAKEKREVVVDDLGYTEEEWKALSEDEKYQAVVDYWHGNGDPEIWFEEEPNE